MPLIVQFCIACGDDASHWAKTIDLVESKMGASATDGMGIIADDWECIYWLSEIVEASNSS